MTKWVVSAIGGRPQGDTFSYINPDVGCSSVEISVVRDDNDHGKKSLGWGGPQKYIIAQLEPLPPKWLWDDLHAVAQKLADQLSAAGAEYVPSEFVENLRWTA